MGVSTAGSDASIAKAAVISLEDFPTSWSTVADTAERSGCFAKPLDEAGAVAAASNEGRFQSDADGQVTSISRVYPDEVTAAAALDIAVTEENFACYGKSIEKALDENDQGLKMTGWEGGDLSFPAVGDDRRAFRYEATIEVDGFETAAIVEVVFVRTGRALTGLSAVQTATPVSTDILGNALAKTSDRARAAQDLDGQ